jgi:chloride channel 3/4/5
MYSAFDSSASWIAVAIMGICTAVVAWLVDIAVATISDWKLGYCSKNPFLSRENCCRNALDEAACDAEHFIHWANGYAARYAIYVAFALAFGIISSSATLLTKASLPAVSAASGDKRNDIDPPQADQPAGKRMYMAAGSGIPEIKTILSGFVIPNFLDFKVLAVKAFGAVFAVSTGMCLGKEGPFVHISTCVGYLIAKQFPKYRNNGRKMREMLSAACASGLSVAFGAPIGGVLFSYEEISTYFPRPVMWHAFLCSLFAAMVLKALNPTGTGKLVLFETDYGTSYEPVHYLVFVVLGIAGGIFGGVFCRVNFMWSRWFRKYTIIKQYPVFEVFLIVLATALIQFPNILIRDPGDVTIKMLLVDCKGEKALEQWVCRQEAQDDKGAYIGWLVYGCLAKLFLTIITFGVKVPSGVIIPALDAGALFGRIIGQVIPGISPGIFAMVGAGAFLGGVSRMTISLCVIMFEVRRSHSSLGHYTNMSCHSSQAKSSTSSRT